MLKIRTVWWLVPLLVVCMLDVVGAQDKAPTVTRDADAKTSMLSLAIQRDDLTGVNALLGRGANANAVDRYGVPPLMVACVTGNAAIVERLLKAGADPNSASPAGMEPTSTPPSGSAGKLP